MSRPLVLALVACVPTPTVVGYRYFSADVRDVEAIGRKRMVVIERGEGAPAAQTFA